MLLDCRQDCPQTLDSVREVVLVYVDIGRHGRTVRHPEDRGMDVDPDGRIEVLSLRSVTP